MLRMNRFLAALLLGAASLSASAFAADSSSARPGSEVRLTPTRVETVIPGVGTIRGGQVLLAPGVTLRRYRMDGPRPFMVDVALPDGSVVMLPLNGVRVQGTMVAADESTITVRSEGGDVVVPKAAASRIDVSLGRQSRWTGVGKGAAFGAGLGVLLGVAFGDDNSRGFNWSREDLAFLGILFLTPVGATVGAIAGGGRNWQPIEPGEVKLAVGPVPKGAAVGVRFGFAGRGAGR